MTHCAFAGCTNDSRYPPPLTFFPFAKPCIQVRNRKLIANDEHVLNCTSCAKCKKWITACRREDKFSGLQNVSRNTYLCQLHFVKDHPFSLDYPDPLPVAEANELKKKIATQKRKHHDDVSNMRNEKRSRMIELQADNEASTGNVENQSTSILENSDIAPSTSTSNLHNRKQNYVLNRTFPPITKTVTLEINKTSRSQQTRWTWKDFETIQAENKRLKLEIISLKKKVIQLEERFSRGGEHFPTFVQSLKDNDKKCKFYTNLLFPQILAFLSFLSPVDNLCYWGNAAPKVTSNRRKMAYTDELILVLVRMRSGLLIKDLSYRFNISEGFISQLFMTWVQHAYCKLDTIRSLMFTPRDLIKDNLPAVFMRLKNIRVLIDFAEFYCQKPTNFEHQGNVYSDYKANSTFKVLLGCTPNGAISFVSDLFEGSISDKDLVKKSKLMDCLEENDLVLADRGFTIKDLTDNKNVSLNIPPFLKGRDRLTPEEEIETKNIAKERIYIEHVVGKLKQFRLLKKVLPLNMRGILSQVVFVCACLINYQEPILRPRD